MRRAAEHPMREEILRLRREGLSMRKIADATGTSPSTVARIVNPEVMKERDRVGNARQLASKRRYTRKTRRTCACGRLMWRSSTRCRDCIRAAQDARRAEFIERWNSGQSSYTIALALDMRPNAVAVQVSNLRKKGYALNYRRPDAIKNGHRLAEYTRRRWA